MKNQSSDLDNGTDCQQVTVWRLDGEEWIRFLNYIHNRPGGWKRISTISSFCCLRESFEHLRDRQYGHIIFYNNGFILDEFNWVSFRTYKVLDVELSNFGENPSTLGLQIRTSIQLGKSHRHISFDLFAPSSVTREQISVIEKLYKQRIK